MFSEFIRYSAELRGARDKLRTTMDQRFIFDPGKNTELLEKRHSFTFEGLVSDVNIVKEWCQATSHIAEWVKCSSPDVIVISGRSNQTTYRSLQSIQQLTQIFRVVLLDESANDILYKTDCSRLHWDEELYEDFKNKSGAYTDSLIRRKSLIKSKLISGSHIPENIVFLDDVIRNGHKAHSVVTWMKETGIFQVTFGALAGPAVTPLAEVGSTDTNFYGFLSNLSRAMVALQDCELDEVAKVDLRETIDRLFNELAVFSGING